MVLSLLSIQQKFNHLIWLTLATLWHNLNTFRSINTNKFIWLYELEWPREDSKITAEERDRAIDELIAIIVNIDGILQNQSAADVDYFTKVCDRSFTDDEVQRIKDGVLKAYRWQ